MDRPDLKFLPGIVKTDSAYARPGRFVDSQWVRFHAGLPEKIGGWTKWAAQALAGVARTMLSWQDNSLNAHLAIGTHKKLYIGNYSDNSWLNATPIRLTGTLTNPFTLSAGLPIATVDHSLHGLTLGDTVNYPTPVTIGGITISGDYIVSEVTSTTRYKILLGVLPTSGVASGGGSVPYSYELNIGLISLKQGGGWGIGTWGTGTWGTSRQSSFKTFPRYWALDKYGQNLLALPSGGKLYYWDVTVGGRALAVANAPDNCLSMFVSNDRHVIILGAGGDRMKIQWPDQSDFTNWTPGPTTTANSRRLQKGSYVVAGTVFINSINLIWTDTTLYLHQYTGSQYVFDTRVIANNAGLVGPKAFVVAGGAAYWMSPNGFLVYNGGVSLVPNQDDIKMFVMNNLNKLQNYKCHAEYIPLHNEVWWNYVPPDSDEPELYVAVNLSDFSWICGSLPRTASGNSIAQNQAPIMVTYDGWVFDHESGLNGDGQAIETFLEYAPFNINSGLSEVEVSGYVPNFQRQAGPVTLDIMFHNYPEKQGIQEQMRVTVLEGSGVIDTRMSGRNVGFKLSSKVIDGDWRLGMPKIETSPNGGRR